MHPKDQTGESGRTDRRTMGRGQGRQRGGRRRGRGCRQQMPLTYLQGTRANDDVDVSGWFRRGEATKKDSLVVPSPTSNFDGCKSIFLARSLAPFQLESIHHVTFPPARQQSMRYRFDDAASSLSCTSCVELECVQAATSGGVFLETRTSPPPHPVC